MLFPDLTIDHSKFNKRKDRIDIFVGNMPYGIDEALRKVNHHRKKRKAGEERVKKILLANGIEDK